MQDKRVGVTSRRGNTYSSGIARIMIPYGVDRDTFVNECYLRSEVSIQPEWNNSIHRVRIDKDVLQQIQFPKTDKELGSQVVFVTIPKWKFPIIVACIDSVQEYGTLKENQFSLIKRTDFGSVSIIGDGKGQLSISVSSEAKKRGLLNISISNPDNTAKLKLNINGTADITASDKVSLLSNSEVDVKVTDGEIESILNITKDEIKQVSASIKHNEGNESMLLGNSTISLLQELINYISTGVVMGMPLSTAANIAQLATQLESLLSQKSTLE